MNDSTGTGSTLRNRSLEAIQEVQQFLIFPTTQNTISIQKENVSCENYALSESHEYTTWPIKVTKRLIALYKEHYSEVGITIKKQKKLWEILAEYLNNEFHLKLTPQQIENKWRTLLRAYKSIVDNNNKTGRARKIFEHQDEFDEIYKKKKNIHPEVLLSEDTVAKSKPSCNMHTELDNQINEQEVSKNVQVSPEEKRKIFIKKRKTVTRNEVLEKIRFDKQRHHEEYMKKMEERLEIEKERLIERKKHNKIQEERNNLLKKYFELEIYPNR